MTNQAESSGPPWETLAAELHAYRSQQRQTWGEVDEATLGRYLADETSPEEKQRVEAALAEHPELRALTDLVQDVLSDYQPEQETAPSPAPRIFSIKPAPARKKSSARRFLGSPVLAAAACLLLMLGVTLIRLQSPEQRTVPTMPGDSIAMLNNQKGMAMTSLAPPGASRQSQDVHFHFEHLLANTASALPPTISGKPLSADQIADVAKNVDQLLILADQKVMVRTSQGVPPVRSGMEVFADGRRQQAEQILQRALPVLVHGVLQEQDAQVRTQCLETLQRAASLSNQTVSGLTNTLQQSKEPQDKVAVVRTLRAIGPSAWRAAPALQTLAHSDSPEMRSEARLALKAVCKPGWPAIHDNDGWLSETDRSKLNEHLVQLQAAHQLQFVAETLEATPERQAYFLNAKSGGLDSAFFAEVTRQHAVKAGAQGGVFVLINRNPPLVHVHLGVEARKQLSSDLSAEKLTQVITEHLQQQQRGLPQAIKLVEAHLVPRR